MSVSSTDYHRSIAGHFNALSPSVKGGWIMVLCATLGTFSGFALFLTITRISGHEQQGLRLVALVVGLAMTLVFARVLDWLREVVATGEARVVLPSWRLFPRLLLLFLSFELINSTMTDATKMFAEEFEALKSVAVAVAGRDPADFGLSHDRTEQAKLLDALTSRVVRDGLPPRGLDQPAGDVAGRVIQLMTLPEQMTLFAVPPNQVADPAVASKLTDADISALADELARLRPILIENVGRKVTYRHPQFAPGSWIARCYAIVEARAVSPAPLNFEQIRALLDDASKSPTAPTDKLTEADRLLRELMRRDQVGRGSVTAPPSPGAALADRPLSDRLREAEVRNSFRPLTTLSVAEATRDCRSALLTLPAEVRHGTMVLAIERVLRDPHLYDVRVFRGRGLDSAVRVAAEENALSAGGTSERVERIREVNAEILAHHLPGIRPAPPRWWSLVVLFFVWGVAAVALGLVLNMIVFGPERDAALPTPQPAHSRSFFVMVLLGIWPAAAAGVIAGLTVLVLRLPPFLYELTVDPCAVDTGPMTHVLFNLVPTATKFLARCSAGPQASLVPVWLVLPGVIGLLILAIAFGFAKVGKESSISKIGLFALLIGLPVMSAGTLLDGLMWLVLLVAMTWLVPSLGLTLLAPYLEPTSRMPRSWGVLAIAIALGFAGLTVLRLNAPGEAEIWLLAVAAVICFTTGIFILRDGAVREVWPLLALTAAVLAVGLTSGVQATFKGALQQLHPLIETSVPKRRPVADVAVPSIEVWRDGVLGRDRSLSEVAAESRPGLVLSAPKTDQAEPKTAVPPVTSRDPSDRVSAPQLELALVGGLTFWLTLGMLVCWAIRAGPRSDHAEA